MAYQPSSVTTGTASLAHIQNVIFYERTAVENLIDSSSINPAISVKGSLSRDGGN